MIKVKWETPEACRHRYLDFDDVTIEVHAHIEHDATIYRWFGTVACKSCGAAEDVEFEYSDEHPFRDQFGLVRAEREFTKHCREILGDEYE